MQNFILVCVGIAVFLVGLQECQGVGPWADCDSYRADVYPGSAQDTRDIQNGDNPCY